MAPSALTARFGEVTYGDRDVIAMRDGLPQFSDARRFVMVSDSAEQPFVWLQSLDEPHLAVALAPLQLLFPDHDAWLRELLRTQEGFPESETLCLYGVVVLHPDPGRMTINLAAPVVLNVERMTAEQTVLDVPVGMTQHPLIEVLGALPQS